MADELEAVGAFATAGLIGRSLGRKTGKPVNAALAAHDPTCANCDAALTGPYCHSCGQRGHVHRSLLHMGEEMIHGVAHFDGKIWRTLPLLAFKPGTLTRDYIEGRRARYVSPMALFLFVVFLMFMVFSFLPSGSGPESAVVIDPNTPAGRTIAAAFKARAEAAQAAVAADVAAGRSTIVAAEIASTWSGISTGQGLVGEIASGFSLVNADIDAKSINTGWPKLDRKLKHYAGNPELLVYKLKNTAYKFSFLLIPISLPFIWLLFFWRRDTGMYDHAVFALYSLSFMSLLATLIAVASGWGWVPWAILGTLMIFAPPIHMYAQLKGTYGLSRFGATWRTFALMIFASIAITLFALAIIAVGVSG